MVNLPQDLLTVGSNVCDFWIWRRNETEGFELPSIPVKIQTDSNTFKESVRQSPRVREIFRPNEEREFDKLLIFVWRDF